MISKRNEAGRVERKRERGEERKRGEKTRSRRKRKMNGKSVLFHVKHACMH